MGEVAVVLLSGGMDSAVAAAWAREGGSGIVALTVDYGQRHHGEIEAARRIAAWAGAREHVLLSVDLRPVGGSVLTGEGEVPKGGSAGGIPVTYVPARNTLLLSLALGLAEVRGAASIVIGVNRVDYSGYPDCRPEFLDAFRALIGVATRAGVEGRAPLLHAPLLDLPKAAIVRLGARLKVPFAETRSCYDPGPCGGACGRCDACRLRREGFAEAGLPDPTRYAPA